eukprot:1158351-Pelagomonas_calceolata.AAC.2
MRSVRERACACLAPAHARWWMRPAMATSHLPHAIACGAVPAAALFDPDPAAAAAVAAVPFPHPTPPHHPAAAAAAAAA